MDVILEGFEQGKTSGTWRVVDGGADPLPPKLAAYDVNGRVFLRKTNHTIDAPVPGEGIAYYYARVSTQIGGDPNAAGALLVNSEPYRIGDTGDPLLDLAVQVDAFANPTPYGLGGPGAPGVAGAPIGPAGGPDPVEVGGPVLNNGTIEPNGVNTPWTFSGPGQVQYWRAEQDGYFSAACKNSVPVYGGVGFYPGVATIDDLKTSGQSSAGTSGKVFVKAGDHFCCAHEGASKLELHASGTVSP